MNIDDLAHKQRLLEAHIRRLRELEVIAATKGQNCPPEVTIEIVDIQRQIQVLQSAVDSLQSAQALPQPQQSSNPIQVGKPVSSSVTTTAQTDPQKPLQLESPEG